MTRSGSIHTLHPVCHQFVWSGISVAPPSPVEDVRIVIPQQNIPSHLSQDTWQEKIKCYLHGEVPHLSLVRTPSFSRDFLHSGEQEHLCGCLLCMGPFWNWLPLWQHLLIFRERNNPQGAVIPSPWASSSCGKAVEFPFPAGIGRVGKPNCNEPGRAWADGSSLCLSREAMLTPS